MNYSQILKHHFFRPPVKLRKNIVEAYYGDFYRPFYTSHLLNLGLLVLFKATTPKLLKVATYA